MEGKEKPTFSPPPHEVGKRTEGPDRKIMLEALLHELEQVEPRERRWGDLPEILDAVTMGELREKLHERLEKVLSALGCDSLQQIVQELASLINSDPNRSPEEKAFHLEKVLTWADCGDRGLLKSWILEKLWYLPVRACLNLLSIFPESASYGKEVMEKMILELPEEALRTAYIKLLSAKL